MICVWRFKKGDSKGDLEQEGPEVGYESKSCKKWNRSETKIAEGIRDGWGRDREREQKMRYLNTSCISFFNIYVLAYINIYLKVMHIGH